VVIETENTFLAPTSGHEPPQFTGDLTVVRDQPTVLTGSNGETISIRRAGAQVCQDIRAQAYRSSTCYDDITIRTGLAYSMVQVGDRAYFSGLVPDDVATVEIGGSTLRPENNVWQYTASADAALSLRIASADGDHVARL
jgi:hypothetical protein